MYRNPENMFFVMVLFIWHKKFTRNDHERWIINDQLSIEKSCGVLIANIEYWTDTNYDSTVLVVGSASNEPLRKGSQIPFSVFWIIRGYCIFDIVFIVPEQSCSHFVHYLAKMTKKIQ